MFNKLKQIKDLRSQAKTMQDTLSHETVTEEKNGVKVVLNGNMEIIELTLNPELNTESQAEAVKSCVNNSIKKAQKIMAKKLQEMGGFPGLG